MHKKHVIVMIVVVCALHCTTVPAGSFLTKLIPEKVKTYFSLSDSKMAALEAPDRSVHMKATDFVMKTIANKNLEEVLGIIKDGEKRQATNFFEEAQKMQALLVQEKYPEILRKKSLPALYKGSAFSITVEREQDTIHIHTEITTTQKVPYRLADDSHTKVHAEYRQFNEGWESITSCETSIPWKDAVNLVHTLNDQKK